MKATILYLSSFSFHQWFLVGVCWLLIPIAILIVLTVIREIREDRKVLREARKPYEHLFREVPK
jgi:hypothetical protein